MRLSCPSGPRILPELAARHTPRCASAGLFQTSTRRNGGTTGQVTSGTRRAVECKSQEGNDKDAPKESDASSSSVDLQPPEIDFDSNDLQLPREVIEQLRYSVFGFDSFFVTSVENYDANGVLFKGNLRGPPGVVYNKLQQKLKGVIGDDYVLYLLENKEGAPVAVVFPRAATEPPQAALPPVVLCALFVGATLLTTLNCNGLPLLDGTGELNADSLAAALPGTIAFLLLLGAHEAGHWYAARREGVRLSLPVFIPAGLGLLGSFGAITQFRDTVPNREALLRISVAGPVVGSVAALGVAVIGLGLSAAGVGGVTVEPIAFKDSLIMGFLGQLFLGDRLLSDAALDLHPLLLAGWAALVVNGLNTIPAGDTDGGRIAAGLWGRRAGTALSTVTLLILGLCGIIDTLALFWVLIIIFLTRGPILPQKDELSAPQGPVLQGVGIALLLLPFLTLLPYPGQVGPIDFDAMPF